MNHAAQNPLLPLCFRVFFALLDTANMDDLDSSIVGMKKRSEIVANRVYPSLRNVKKYKYQLANFTKEGSSRKDLTTVRRILKGKNS